jgi:hypothetical protein
VGWEVQCDAGEQGFGESDGILVLADEYLASEFGEVLLEVHDDYKAKL